MNYLVDTHIFLWIVLAPKNNSKKVTSIFLDSNQTKYVSIVTFWEISLKFSLGKLDLAGIPPEQLPAIAKETGLTIAPLEITVATSFYKLPIGRHKDPFDRMLAWQAICGKYMLITKDQSFDVYKKQGLQILW